MFRDDPLAGVRLAANAVGADTDTIADGRGSPWAWEGGSDEAHISKWSHVPDSTRVGACCWPAACAM
jgi:hypothetical protein